MLPRSETNAFLEYMLKKPLMVSTLFDKVKKLDIGFQALDQTWTPKVIAFIRILAFRKQVQY